MIFNMTGGGSGSGATLVVSCPANVTVTVSKDDKSYTKNSGNLGSATFKGLTTGTWSVKIQSSSQTATKNITITADYAITMAFFAAYINVTYPANSNCVVQNSGGVTVASDANTDSSAKTWTATVGATGTYTVTATATDGSGKTKSTTVSITTDGQSESVTLKYSLDIIVNGKFNYDVIGSWVAGDSSSGAGSLTEQNGYVQIYGPTPTVSAGSYTSWVSTKALPTSEYKTLYVDYESTFNGFSGVEFVNIGGVSVTNVSPTVDARNTRAADISNLNTNHQLALIARVWSGEGHLSPVTINIYNLYLE